MNFNVIIVDIYSKQINKISQFAVVNQENVSLFLISDRQHLTFLIHLMDTSDLNIKKIVGYFMLLLIQSRINGRCHVLYKISACFPPGVYALF